MIDWDALQHATIAAAHAHPYVAVLVALLIVGSAVVAIAMPPESTLTR